VIATAIAPTRSALPAVLSPSRAGESILDAVVRLQPAIDAHLRMEGGVLLRGFDVPNVDAFRQFAASFGHPLLNYEFASTPRSLVSSGVYTSTEYPAHQHIPLHSEQSYTREWPMKIWFHCVVAPAAGGETPIADTRAIHRRLSRNVRERFQPGILYVRNFGEFDVPWQKVFNTERRDEVEAFCRRAQIRWEWGPDGALRTEQVCQSVEVHPVTGETVWFNQGHLFHISSLPPEVRESLVDLLGIDRVPRNVFFRDGSLIEDAVFEEIRQVLAEEAIVFPWQAGDVLMLDNMLAAHARTPFKGPRKVVVAMAEPRGNLNTFAAS
jgi:alpha-ketoglutarate-dependent taurine dioxygenase